MRSRRVYRLEEVVGSQSQFRLRLVEWDGKYIRCLYHPYSGLIECRTPIPIVDISGKLIGILAGFPGPAAEWCKVQEEAWHALEDARRRSKIPHMDKTHRRGKFKTLRCGVSHGRGQTEPGNLQNNDINSLIAEELNALEPFKRLAGFATCTYLITL